MANCLVSCRGVSRHQGRLLTLLSTLSEVSRLIIPESAVYQLSAVHSFRSFPFYYPSVCCVRDVCCPLYWNFPISLSQSLLCTSCLLSTLLECSHFIIPESAVYELSAVHSFRSFPLNYPRVCCVRAVCCPLIPKCPLFYPRICCVQAVCCPVYPKFPTLLSQSMLCTSCLLSTLSEVSHSIISESVVYAECLYPLC